MQSSWCATMKRGVPYACGRRGGKFVYMHRVITDAPAGRDVDHTNHNSLDNRRSNLRIVTRSQNNMNGMKRKNGKASRFKGICFNKTSGKWQGSIQVDKRKIYLGLFATEKEAARAYNEAALKYFGEYARLNDLSKRGEGDENQRDGIRALPQSLRD